MNIEKDKIDQEPYYMAYEKRYRSVYAAGAERWGHSPDDLEFRRVLIGWVSENRLVGKRIAEFACGEGAAGVILSESGCEYVGFDISPTAVEKAREALKPYPSASVKILDMVKQRVSEKFDAALDCMGFHMLVTDADRAAYLKNANAALKGNAPMLFLNQSYRSYGSSEAVYHGRVESLEDWVKITGSDYVTPSLRRILKGDEEIELSIPLVPARANDREGYITELEAAGFTVERFVENDISQAIIYSANIFARKRTE